MTDPGALALADQWDAAARDLWTSAREAGDRNGNSFQATPRLPVWLQAYLDDLLRLLDVDEGDELHLAWCPHLTGAPQVIHAYAGLLGVLACGGCAATAEHVYRRAAGVCDWCGRDLWPDGARTGHVVRGALALHFRCCGRCYDLLGRWEG